MVKTKKLKVFGGCFDGRNREIVAASSKVEAGRLFGRKSHTMRDFCCETGNTEEVETAMSQPGVVFTVSATRRRSGEPYVPKVTK